MKILRLLKAKAHRIPGRKFAKKNIDFLTTFFEKIDTPTFEVPEFLNNRLFGAIPGFLGTVGVFFYQKLTIFSKFLAGNSRRFHGFHGKFFTDFSKTIKFFPGNRRVFPGLIWERFRKIDKIAFSNTLYNSILSWVSWQKNDKKCKKNRFF